MSDIIQLLPDSVANQIAAGEVIQRPASVVKELLENSVDAGSTQIRLIIKDAGKSLIQVSDNGCGMSGTDARLSFERHATSKIRQAEDLFRIRTMGFRGEAMASIVAIAQVEMRTKLADEDLGVLIYAEGSEIKSQEPASCAAGTSISVKNLFYNIPARRNFLKPDNTEYRHILDEFHRVALANTQIAFSLHHNGQEIYNLTRGPILQRINQLFGNSMGEKLVPVKEETTLMNISGFAGKPEFARKTRGEQYFFVNQRFIKDPFLNHAVVSAYDQMLAAGSYPSYFLFIETDPSKIDINIHPTKTEIKFEDERAIYGIVRSAVKRALGKFSVTPTLDFDQDPTLNRPPSDMPLAPSVSFNPEFNPFRSQGMQSKFPAKMTSNWEKLYELNNPEPLERQQQLLDIENEKENTDNENQEHFHPGIFQLHNRYIITPVKSGVMVIDQRAAHERILYERYLSFTEEQPNTSQQELFPLTIEMSASDYAIITEMENEVRQLGFDIRPFGNNTIVVQGTPTDVARGKEKEVLEAILELYKNNADKIKLSVRENLAKAFASSMSVKSGQKLDISEMKNLIDELFACQSPSLSLSGKPTLTLLSLEELAGRFDKKA